jgi:hypothetical protein
MGERGPERTPEWITSTTACQIGGFSRHYLRKLASDGVLTHRRVGSAWTWYLRVEVEALAAKSIVRARRDTAKEAVACAS